MFFFLLLPTFNTILFTKTDDYRLCLEVIIPRHSSKTILGQYVKRS